MRPPPDDRSRTPRKLPGLAGRAVPRWAQTIRFRLAITSALVMLALASAVVAGLNFAVTGSVEAAPLNPVTVTRVDRQPDGQYVARPGEPFEAADLAGVQRAVRFHVLEKLRAYSVYAIGGLAIVTMFVAWSLSGRALTPVRRITSTARDISATDLSQRIALNGPRDELHSLADTMDEMLERLERAFVSQRNLVDDASHELRNPLAVIQANLEAVLSRDDLDPEERQQATKVISRSTERMIDLVENLLVSARLRAETFDEAEVDLADVAHDTLADTAALAQYAQVRLVARADPRTSVIADPVALQRALHNLLSNAIRFAPPGSEVQVTAGSQLGWCYLAVRDHGPGIPREHQQQIFHRFEQASNQPDRPGASPRATSVTAGLGLAITRQIVESHGGSIAVHSTPGSGSTFVMWLPTSTQPAEGYPPRSPDPPRHNPNQT